MLPEIQRHIARLETAMRRRHLTLSVGKPTKNSEAVPPLLGKL